MAVVGGETKSLFGRVVELAGWWPFLTAGVGLGAMSALQAFSGADMPAWTDMPMGLYHTVRDLALNTTLGPNIDPKWADAGFAGIGLFTMATRRVMSFLFSIGGFLALLVIGWYLLKEFGGAAAVPA